MTDATIWANLDEWVALALTIIGGVSIIVKGVAVITDVTPGTRDDEVVSQTQGVIRQVQKVLGAISFDASNQRPK